MHYNLIVACSNNYGIGNNGTLPWNIPNDLKRFSKLTKGNGNNAVIMGRKTWDSLPIKPLPNRVNIILSSNQELITKYRDNKNILFFSSFDDIDSFCQLENFNEVWVIGGASIYKHYLITGRIDNIYMTYINKYIECDTTICFLNDLQHNYQIIEKIIDKYENTEIYYIKLFKLEAYKEIKYSYKSWKQNEEIIGSGKIINWMPIGPINDNNFLIFIKDDNKLNKELITIHGTCITYIS